MSKSSRLIEANNDRLLNAGRPGTSNCVDPTKIFVGNLPYDATERDLNAAFATYWNVNGKDVDMRIQSMRIVRDWKTGVSKGYGFVQFYDADATSAMEGINGLGRGVGGGGEVGGGGGGGGGGGLRIGGRRIRLDQGKWKEMNDNDEGGKKKKTKAKTNGTATTMITEEDLDEEGRVIYTALRGDEDDDIDASPSSSSFVVANGKGGTASAPSTADEAARKEGIMSEDDMIAFIERGGLRGAMALTEETAGYLGVKGLYVRDDDDDDIDDDDEEEDETEEFDFEAYYKQNGYREDDYGDIDLDIDANDDENDDENDDDGSEMIYDGVFEEMYDPNEYEGLTEEEEANMAKINGTHRLVKGGRGDY